jgi:uncharacterized membrane protein YeaQ/YmgE (transglycosylase-associated protein family)/SOS response regulatory protein OraA/RecX
MVGSVISIVVTAFITGALARFAVPGPDPMPAWLTVLIGLVGTLIGAGIVFAAVGNDPAWFGITGFLISILLVIGYRRLVQKRAVWGPDAYRFPKKGIGVEEYRQRLERAGIDPEAIGSQIALALEQRQHPDQEHTDPDVQQRPPADDPTDNPSHYLTLLEELHDSGVLNDEEYAAAKGRLIERLRA